MIRHQRGKPALTLLALFFSFVSWHISAGDVGSSPRLERHADGQEVGEQHARCGAARCHCSGEYRRPLYLSVLSDERHL